MPGADFRYFSPTATGSPGLTAFLFAFLLLGLVPPGHAQKAGSTPEIAEKRADLDDLRNRIEELRKTLNSTEDSRAEAADRLRESERQISRLQRKLHELAQQRLRLQQQLEAHERQSRDLSQTLNQQQRQLEKLLHRQYLRGTPDSLQTLLNGDDPNQLSRDLHYLSTIAASRAEMMSDINRTLAEKKALAADTRARTAELAEVEAAEQKHHEDLAQQRAERLALHNEISQKVRAQKKEIGALQRDEKRLSQLVDRLTRVLAQQAAARAAEEAKRRREAAAEAARQAAKTSTSEKSITAQASAPSPSQAQPAGTNNAGTGPENRLEPIATNVSFSRLKGKLRLPVRGTLLGRFGKAREGGGQWRGLFIRSDTGAPVKSIANGQVVFSEWMRGFGNLLIVDHGNDYLSIYGNNDSLLKQVGQTVTGGETIATVGNTGGNAQSGLYFEIRHKGQPIDPMSWATLK